jgi:hypothetical protein
MGLVPSRQSGSKLRVRDAGTSSSVPPNIVDNEVRKLCIEVKWIPEVLAICRPHVGIVEIINGSHCREVLFEAHHSAIKAKALDSFVKINMWGE